MSNFNTNQIEMIEDVNQNLLIYNQNHCEIKIICDKCEANTKTNSNLWSDHVLEYNKRSWKVPWFLIIISFLQISFYWIANVCVRQRLIFMPEAINEYWRYFSYMLLHSDLLHLMMNVCLQFLIGFCLESEQGHLKVACIYVIGGVAGSLATCYLQPQLSLMGASAGVYAMLMSHIPHLLKNFPNLCHRYLRIWTFVILFISDVCFTTFHVLINHNTNPRISLEGHAAGAISGLLFGFLIYSATTTTTRKTVIWRKRSLKSQEKRNCDHSV